MKLKILIIGMMILFSLAFVSAQSSYVYYGGYSNNYYDSNPQTYSPNFNNYYTSSQIATYWNIYNNDNASCEARQDFIIQIPPGGCSPAVVRSDLLADQDVPVFCQLSAIKLNPLVDINSIDSITFNGKYPNEVRGTSFHPARAAIRTNTRLLGSPILNNIGYVVILLKRNAIEANLSDFVNGNLTARITYDVNKAFGAGRGEFALRQMSDEEWQQDYKMYSFWRGQGYLRLENLDDTTATVGVYKDVDTKISTVSLQIGKISKEVYLPGFYCKVGTQLTLNSIQTPKPSAKISISGKEEQELMLYEKESFLNGKCSIYSITPQEIGGSVIVRCGSKSYELKIGTANNFQFSSVDGTTQNKKSWEKLDDYYVAYYSKVSKNVYPVELDNDFVVLVKSKLPLTENDKTQLTKQIDNAVKSAGDSSANKNSRDKFAADVEKRLISGNIIDAIVSFKGGETISSVIFTGAEISNIVYDEPSRVEEFFKNAVDNYKILVSSFPSETAPGEQISFAAKGIINGVKLAMDLSKGKTALELIDLGKKVFTGTTLDELNSFESDLRYSGSAAVLGVNVDNEYYVVRLESIDKPTRDDASSHIYIKETEPVESTPDIFSETYSEELNILDKEGDYGIGDYLYSETERKMTKGSCFEYVKLEDLKQTSAIISYRAITYTAKSDGTYTETCNENKNLAVNLEEWKSLGRFNINVRDIRLKNIAKVTLLPKVSDTGSILNFSYHIGIEKRAIKLTPDVTAERIKNLNESIKKWDDINEKLGTVVSVGKGACLATSAFIIAKNLVSGFSGESLARQKVMRESGGWVDKCKELVEKDPTNYPSLDVCFSKKSSEIENDVSKVSTIMANQNSLLEASRQGQTNKGILDDLTKENSIDSKKTALDYYNKNRNLFSGIDYLQDSSKVEKLINSGELGLNDLRDIASAQQMKNSDSNILQKLANNTLKQQGDYIKLREDLMNQQTLLASKTGIPGLENKLDSHNLQILQGVGGNKPFVNPITLSSSEAGNFGGDAGKYVFYVVPGNMLIDKFTPSSTTTNLNVAVKLKQVSGEYVVDKVYNVDDKTDVTSQFNTALKNAGISSFREYSSEMCKNNYLKPEVRYYESGAYKGFPAVVPVDVNNGWYAATKQASSTLFGNIQSIQESGKIVSFWLCNVGANKIEDFNSASRDDICTMINLQTGQPLDEVGCLSSSEAKAMVSKATQALYSAADQYGKSIIEIKGVGTFKVGNPAVNVPSAQCQDFMSAQDCNLIFNVCDPVICPSSRCNLGGTFYVDDVVQSGIIGSIALCLPNFGNPSEGGVIIPVCLSGIHAGIESYVSILKAHRDCLQESLNSGQMVGICDEIYSIYTCDFFWRQIVPFMKAIIPKLISLAYGQGTRGGGEYATVTAAWNNAQKSVDYMTTSYAANAYKAFNLRSTDEVGTEVCKAFIGTRYPSNKNLFDSLLQPDSPVQFTAYFSETVFTEATVPSTSDYKVFYHIYAGKDVGVSYSVYLKNPPATSFYNQNPFVQIRTGYIGTGDYKDETIDFTAPSGYKELCVRINSQDNCGFKQVSSSAAITYANDLYMKEQASQTVNSEAECISGTSSAYSFLQPNIQAGAEEALNPAIYNRGIIRVCASLDPGVSTDPTQITSSRKWQSIGYCDKNAGIRCWEDIDSVKNVIKDKGIENQTLTDIQANVQNSLLQAGEIYSPVQTVQELDKIGDFSRGRLAKLIQDINSAKTKSDLDSIYQTAINPVSTSTTDVYAEKVAYDYTGIFTDINRVIDKAYYNYQKAEAIYMKTQIYDQFARAYAKFWEAQQEIAKEAAAKQTLATEAAKSPGKTTTTTSTTTPDTSKTPDSEWVDSTPLFSKDSVDTVTLGQMKRATYALKSGGESHHVGVVETVGSNPQVEFASTNVKQINMGLNQKEEYDANVDGVNDISIKLNKINPDYTYEFIFEKLFVLKNMDIYFDGTSDLKLEASGSDYIIKKKLGIIQSIFNSASATVGSIRSGVIKFTGTKTQEMIYLENYKLVNNNFVRKDAVSSETFGKSGTTESQTPTHALVDYYRSVNDIAQPSYQVADSDNPFKQFIINGDGNEWTNENTLFLKDYDVTGKSGYLALQIKPDFQGTVVLKMTLSSSELWWSDSNNYSPATKRILARTDTTYFNLQAGDYIEFDIDKEFNNDYGFYGKFGSEEIKNTNKIDTSITFTLIKIDFSNKLNAY